MMPDDTAPSSNNVDDASIASTTQDLTPPASGAAGSTAPAPAATDTDDAAGDGAASDAPQTDAPNKTETASGLKVIDPSDHPLAQQASMVTSKAPEPGAPSKPASAGNLEQRLEALEAWKAQMQSAYREFNEEPLKASVRRRTDA